LSGEELADVSIDELRVLLRDPVRAVLHRPEGQVRNEKRGREHMETNHPAIAAVITDEQLTEMVEEE
jgi:hypothetical protein